MTVKISALTLSVVPLLILSMAFAQQPAKKANRGRRARDQSTGLAIGENKATPVGRIKAAKGFQVELLYSVPGPQEGSWVNLCVDDKGRILASDQYGGLYRFVPPASGRMLDPAAIDKVPANIKAVNGMVWAFGALYVAVNDYENTYEDGLYRVTDSDGDDRLDRVEQLRGMQASGDHGVHALVPTPDGKALFLITGNGTKRTAFNSSRVPQVWGEDHLLPRMPDGRGFMRDVLAPGGIIYRVTPDGRNFEVVSTGYRNIFDAAVNRDGELFTYDADMEYDFNTSWYRPTRVCHVTSGSEFGWRNGAGKRPEWYPDNLPPVINIGPGSPTGVVFGYGAKFPAKYQEALFILDWSWGKLYAVHLKPDGATYTATKEEFVSGAPLPLTDAIIHPADGAMYFAIGGRKVQSGLYRVTYVGNESTALVEHTPHVTEESKLRRRLETYHGVVDSRAVSDAWPHLSHPDRFVRWAARTALEHQPAVIRNPFGFSPDTWADQALRESDPAKQVEALLALVRVTGIDPLHRGKTRRTDPPVDEQVQAKILAALLRLDWDRLAPEQQVTVVRTYEICFVRFGQPDAPTAAKVVAQLDAHFPAPTRELNWVLCETLAYLQSPTVAAKAMALIRQAPAQEEQIEYARSIRFLKAGWTSETHAEYFRWFLKAANFHGGASFEKFIEFIRADAVASLSEPERIELASVLAEQPVKKSLMEGLADAFKGRTPTNWTLDELSQSARTSLSHRNYDNGRKMFGAAACFTCHRFGNEGGMNGPDLTGAGGRYSPHDLLDQVVNPSKEINEQFVPIAVTTEEQVITGVVVNLNGDTVTLNTDGADPNQRVTIDRKQVLSIEPSKLSPMPTGLLNLLTNDEVLDLVAYVLSGGDPRHELFKK